MQKLPIISTLTPEATAAYITRVNAWLSGDRSDLTEGVLLCTALPQATIFVDYATAYSADKRRGEIVKYLTGLCPISPISPIGPISPKTPISPSRASSISSPSHENCLPLQGVGGSSFVTPAGTIYTFSPDGSVTAVGGNRPSHFDEWLDRMPADLQDKIATIKENFDYLVYYRRKVEQLASDPNHSQSELSRYARLAVAYEARNLNIFAQADICWDELCGRPVSPDLKKELAQEERKLIKELKTPQPPKGGDIPTVSSGGSHENCLPLQGVGGSGAVGSISPDQAQKYIRDKFNPETASPAQREKAEQYARIILQENGKFSKKVAAKLAAAGITCTEK